MNPVEKVPLANVISIIIVMILAIAIPVMTFIILRKKLNGKTKSFFVGCGVFLVFALILEQVFKLPFYLISSIISLFSKIVNFFNKNLLISSLFGALLAGLFEEFGRFTAFKTILQKELNDDFQSFMYGAGHAGMEIIAILFVSMVSNLYYSILINSGNINTLLSNSGGATAHAILLIKSQLINTKFYVFYLSIFERLFAFISHISFSVIVWFACKNKKDWFYLPIAIFLHAGLDFVSVILSSMSYPVWLIELFILLISVLNAIFAYFTWKSKHSKPRFMEVEEA